MQSDTRTAAIAVASAATLLLSFSALWPQNTPNASAPSPPAADTLNHSILLVTHSSLRAAWQDFADWKTSTGRPTEILVPEFVEWVDHARQLKRLVRKRLDKGTLKWVILGGDSALDNGTELVPTFYTIHSETGQIIPTDLVYLSPTDLKNWTNSEDRDEEIYGDWNVSIGRIPLRTPEDVKAYTEKVIEYETQYPAEGDYVSTMFYAAHDYRFFRQLKVAFDSWIGPQMPSSARSQRWFYPSCSNDSTLLADSAPDECLGNLSGKGFATALHWGASGRVHINSHAFLEGWALGDDMETSMFSTKHIENLDHAVPGTYPIITTPGCQSGEYDSEVVDPVPAEALLRQPHGGAAVVISPSRHGIAMQNTTKRFKDIEDKGLPDGMIEVFSRFWGNTFSDGFDSVGRAWRAAQAELAGRSVEYEATEESRTLQDIDSRQHFHFWISQLNVLGDPSLPVHNAPPMQPVVGLEPKVLRVGSNYVRLFVGFPDLSGAPAQRLAGVGELSVCAWQRNGTLYEMAKIGRSRSSVRATGLRLALEATGDVSLAISGRNVNTVVIQVSVE